MTLPVFVPLNLDTDINTMDWKCFGREISIHISPVFLTASAPLISKYSPTSRLVCPSTTAHNGNRIWPVWLHTLRWIIKNSGEYKRILYVRTAAANSLYSISTRPDRRVGLQQRGLTLARNLMTLAWRYMQQRWQRCSLTTVALSRVDFKKSFSRRLKVNFWKTSADVYAKSTCSQLWKPDLEKSTYSRHMDGCAVRVNKCLWQKKHDKSNENVI